MTRKEFDNLSWKERQALANKRMFGGEKWIVFDYYPKKDGTYGAMQKCPKAVDSGWTHGFKFENPIVPITDNVDYPFEVNCYWNYYEEDKTDDNNVWHIFTSKEKAEEYAKTLNDKLYREITNEDVLEVLHTIPEFKDAEVVVGKRNYEGGKPYECIMADGYGYTTMKIVDKRYIEVTFGQWRSFIIPHIDLLKRAFTENVTDGHYMNYNYAEDPETWDKFYGITERQKLEKWRETFKKMEKSVVA